MGKRENIQNKEKIFNFIKKYGIMTLATQSNKGPWVCTVYYGIDESMNFYIVSNPNSSHCKNITKNNKVAFNICDSRQKIYKPKIGVQGRGTIKMVKGIVNIAKALKLWHKQNPGVEKQITLSKVKKITETKVWKITPIFLKLFDEEIKSDTHSIVWEK